MIERLGQLASSYTAGTVTYTRSSTNFLRGKSGNPFYVFNAKGDAVKGLDSPHITIWAAYGAQAWMREVEFTWSESKHVVYNRRWRDIRPGLNLHGGDHDTAANLETQLLLFLVTAQIVTNAANVQRTWDEPQTTVAAKQELPNFALDFPPLK